jgi:Uma2 family endonuclease
LIIEVADSSLLEDRRRKSRVYARSGIRVYWIVNINESQIEVLTQTTGRSGAPAYQSRVDYKIGESVPLIVGGTEHPAIPVKDLLP